MEQGQGRRTQTQGTEDEFVPRVWFCPEGLSPGTASLGAEGPALPKEPRNGKFRQGRGSRTDLQLKTELGGKCRELEPKGMDGSVWWHNPLGEMTGTL